MCWHSLLSNLDPGWDGLEFLILVYLRKSPNIFIFEVLIPIGKVRSRNHLGMFPAPIRPAVIQLLLCRLNDVEFIGEHRRGLTDLATIDGVLGCTTPLNLIQAWWRDDIKLVGSNRQLKSCSDKV
jgi:hypothetical protein